MFKYLQIYFLFFLFSKLLVKDVNAKEKTESNQQTESAVNGGGKPVEKGQGDASLNVSQTVKDN